MISIDNIGTLLKEGECNHIRIYDRNGTAHLLNIDDDNVDNAIDKLKANIKLLSGYGVLTIKGGNDTIHKRSMAGASVWKVFFNETPSNSNTQIQQQPINTGYTKEYLDTLIALNTLKLQIDFDKKERELEKKFSGGDEEKYFKYAPLLGGLLGWTDEQMMQKLKMCQMAGGLSGMQTNTPVQNKLTIEGTDLEKEKLVETLVPQIYEKVDKNKFIAVLQAINQNPEFIESAYSYMSMTTPGNSAMAGQNPASKSESNVFDDYIQVGFIDTRHDENF